MRVIGLLTLVLVGCPDTSKPEFEVEDTGWPGDETAGWVGTDGDCDGGDPYVGPDAEEICDGTDNNCNGEIDENGSTPYYADADGDGFGDATSVDYACEPASGYVSNADDCDDLDAAVYPGAEDICDGIDNNCDAVVDDGATLYADADADGYGDPSVTTCDALEGYVTDATDCDDADAAAYPGATEECDAADNDCDDEIDEDDVCG